MIPALIQPKNTVFCKKAYSNTIRQKWPPMSVSKLGVQQNSLLSELLGKGCLDPCRLSLASPQSHHRAQFGVLLFCCWLCRNSRCAVWHWLEQGGAQLTRCAELEAAAWAERRCWLAGSADLLWSQFLHLFRCWELRAVLGYSVQVSLWITSNSCCYGNIKKLPYQERGNPCW